MRYAGQLAKFRRHRSCRSGWPDRHADSRRFRELGGCKLRAHGAFGTRETQQTNAKGHPDFPVTDDELLAKFKANLRYAKVSDEKAAELADAIMEIDNLSDVQPLADAIAGAVE